MAQARFRFHSELVSFLARERRSGAFSHGCARAATVKHAVESLGVPHTEAGRLLVNGQPATLDRIVREGDDIEVFPREEGWPEDEPLLFLADAHRIIVTGRTRLRGGRVLDSRDLRSGMSLIAAGLAADGQTRVAPLETVERGYSQLVERLQGLGARVAKVE